MAAFLDGKLAPGEVAEVAAHLRECADCRTVTGEAARFEREEEPVPEMAPVAPPAKPRAVPRRWTWAAAAAVAIAALLTIFRTPAPLATLVDASPREYRRVQGRLSGFPWAELRGGPRSAAPSQAAELKLRSAANDVLSRTIDDEAVKARHAAGVAHLLIDQNAESLEKLASAAGDSKDAAIWNDLAAARLAVAVGGGEKAELSRALAAADRAIQLDPDLPDAYFNRALILEELGLREQAREEWQRYLRLDPSSDWSVEARQHLRKLEGVSAKPDFKKELARAAGDRGAIADLVRRFPQESRKTGEGGLLLQWADAHLANDAARAEKTWSLIRTIAEELAAMKGERLLLHTVERMRDRDAFAKGFLVYGEGQMAYRAGKYATAEESFRRAQSAFRAAGSPFAEVAEYFALQCLSDRYHTAEANAALHALRARIDPSHRALAAEIDWNLARNANGAADWATAAEMASRARAVFTELGELQNAAWNAGIEAMALEYSGALEEAWERRVQAIAADPAKTATILEPAVLWLAASDDISEARSLLDLALRAKGNAASQTRSLTLHARLAERAGDLDAAHRSLGEARKALRNVADPDYRTGLQAQVDIAGAVVRRAADPQACITALDASIAFLTRHGQNLYLPDAYLQRARSYRALDRNDAAVADYAASLRAIDEQPKSRSNIEFLDVAEHAIDEKIELHLDRGEVRAAFDAADRAHAMAGADYRFAGVPDGTLLLEYVVLPRSLAIFSVTRDSITATRVPVERARLAARVKSFLRDMQALKDMKASSAALHALLIAPVAQQVAGARELVIVPDRQLNLVPFSALHDGTRYLLETHLIRIAPSAADRRAPAAPRLASSAIVIANPANDRVASLPWSRQEADGIASIYGAAVLEGKDATRTRVSEAIASSDIVHYAGHADSNAGTYGALLLASGADDPGLLTATDIARLDLRARPLVTLAACGTLRGDTTHIAGTPSIARAFLDAGARAVAGTLWEIDDDVASQLFRRFHEHLRAGEVPAGALRAAQLAMLQTSDPRLSHPSSWSAVEVLSHLY